jgi:hypothetical protein
MYPMLRKSNTGLNRPEATTPCPSTLVRRAWAARRSSVPADRRRRGDVGSRAPVQYPYSEPRRSLPCPGLSLFRGTGQSAQPRDTYYRGTRLRRGTSSSSPGLLLGTMLHIKGLGMHVHYYPPCCIMLVWSGRQEPDFRAQHRWRGSGPALYSSSPPQALLPATPGRPAGLRSACRCPAAGPRPASPGARPLARPASWRAPSHPPAARAAAPAGLSAPRSFSARSSCPVILPGRSLLPMRDPASLSSTTRYGQAYPVS